MAGRLTDAKPLSEPMLDYCQLDPCEHISMKIYQNTAIFIEENARENVVCEMASILSRPQCVNRHLSQLGGSLESCLWHTDTINGTLSALIFIRKQQGGHKTQLHLGALTMYWRLRARLWYLQYINDGDTTGLHQIVGLYISGAKRNT